MKYPVFKVLMALLAFILMNSCRQQTKETLPESIKTESSDNDLTKNDTLTNNTETKRKESELAFVLGFKGGFKFNHEEEILMHPIIQARLVNMLGENYSTLLDLCQVVTPVEINDSLMSFTAMEAHSGGNPSFILACDVANDVIFIGIRNGEKEEYFNEFTDLAYPEVIEKWSYLKNPNQTQEETKTEFWIGEWYYSYPPYNTRNLSITEENGRLICIYEASGRMEWEKWPLEGVMNNNTLFLYAVKKIPQPVGDENWTPFFDWMDLSEPIYTLDFNGDSVTTEFTYEKALQGSPPSSRNGTVVFKKSQQEVIQNFSFNNESPSLNNNTCDDWKTAQDLNDVVACAEGTWVPTLGYNIGRTSVKIILKSNGLGYRNFEPEGKYEIHLNGGSFSVSGVEGNLSSYIIKGDYQAAKIGDIYGKDVRNCSIIWLKDAEFSISTDMKGTLMEYETFFHTSIKLAFDGFFSESVTYISSGGRYKIAFMKQE